MYVCNLFASLAVKHIILKNIKKILKNYFMYEFNLLIEF